MHIILIKLLVNKCLKSQSQAVFSKKIFVFVLVRLLQKRSIAYHYISKAKIFTKKIYLKIIINLINSPED